MQGNARSGDVPSELVGLARGGDGKALAELLASIKPLLAGFIGWMQVPLQDREDACQEAVLEVIACLKTFDPSRNPSFKAYALICVKHRLFDLYYQRPTMDLLGDADTSVADPLAAADGPLVEGALDLQTSLSRLGPNLRRMVEARYGLGDRPPLSVGQVATVLRESRAYVQRGLDQALKVISGEAV
jgi:RNA polymerase sigma factor (sigma-70 family)